MTERTVAVAGAGPVGLLFALCAHAEGLTPIVLERRPERRGGSRAIGVHPPALEILERLGLAERFVERGVRVRRGLAFGSLGLLGAVTFDKLPRRYGFVLAIPQEETEAILAEALDERVPGAVRVGLEAADVREDGLVVRDESGAHRVVQADALVACDGKHSAVRRACHIPVEDVTYDGRFAMGDFPDTTGYGQATAAVFLTRNGLVESFPLPGRQRRWVIRRAEDACGAPTADEVAATVWERTAQIIPTAEGRNISGFSAERRIATHLSEGTIALAGDAGHVVSPIGGQGMNLGWLGAAQLARTLSTSLRDPDGAADAIAADAARRRRTARTVARRAELNMWLGRPTRRPESRDHLIRTLLRRPSRNALARAFSMHNLELGV